MRTINRERGLEFKIILNASKDVFMLRSRICRLHFDTEKVLGTYFVRCDMNDVTIPHALCIEKNIMYSVISFREG